MSGRLSEWAGHHSVAFTLTRYGGLFDDGTDAASTASTTSLKAMAWVPMRPGEAAACMGEICGQRSPSQNAASCSIPTGFEPALPP